MENNKKKMERNKKEIERNKKEIVPQPGPSNLGPPLKNANGKIVTSGQRIIIVNMYKHLTQEQPNLTYLQTVYQISKLSGIGTGTIKNTISEYKRTGTVSSPNKKKNRLSICDKLTDEEKLAVRKVAYEVLAKEEVPSLDKILNTINADSSQRNYSRSTLHRVLKTMDIDITARPKPLKGKDHVKRRSTSTTVTEH